MEASLTKRDPRTIVVGERQRKEYGNLDDLAKSIKEKGIIQPISITPDDILIAGGRRLAAALQLGIYEVPVIVRFDIVTPALVAEIELEENLHRKDLTGPEELTARVRLDRLREVQAKARGEVHSSAAVGREIGISKAQISKDKSVYAAMQQYPELAQLPSRKAVYSRYRQLRIQELLREKARRASTKVTDSIFVGRCPEMLGRIQSDSINLAITDFPFGVDIRNSQQKKMATMATTGYSDDFDTVMDDIVGCAGELHRVLMDGSHIYMFCSQLQFPLIYRAYTEVGFTMDDQCLVWTKPSNINQNPYERFTHCTEMCAWGFKGERCRPLAEPSPRDVFDFQPPQNKVHIAQKPLALIERFILLSSQPDEVVLDCFCGSGSTLVAAINTGRKCIGIDANPECVAITTARVQETVNEMTKRAAQMAELAIAAEEEEIEVEDDPLSGEDIVSQ